jgi:hypothetical protein
VFGAIWSLFFGLSMTADTMRLAAGSSPMTMTE